MLHESVLFFNSLANSRRSSTFINHLHWPPATYLTPNHQLKIIVLWWYTCKNVTWSNFLRMMKNTCWKKKDDIAFLIICHIVSGQILKGANVSILTFLEEKGQTKKKKPTKYFERDFIDRAKWFEGVKDRK